MPYTPLKIHIPEPCGENWEAMSPVADTSARHCDSCAKNVVDFTGFTDAQTHAYMRESKGKLCGRFRPDQVGRPLRAAGKPRSSLLKAAASAAGFLLAATGCEITSATTDTLTENRPDSERYTPEVAATIPMTGEIAPVDFATDERGKEHIKVAPWKCGPPPPPPPIARDPPEDHGDEEIFGDISPEWFEDEIQAPPLPVAPPPPPPPGTYQNRIPVADSIIPVPPPPPPPLPHRDDVMGIIIYEPPATTGIIDTLRNILNPPADTALQPPAHPRPRPDLAPTYLQNLEPYPNPFVDEITLELDAPEKEGLNIELLDASGRRILTQSWELASGFNRLVLLPRQRKLKGQLFYLRLITESGRVITKTIVRR